MDIKVEGITLEIMRSALKAAHAGRTHILGEMRKCSPAPRNAMSDFTPRIVKMQVCGGLRQLETLNHPTRAQLVCFRVLSGFHVSATPLALRAP